MIFDPHWKSYEMNQAKNQALVLYLKNAILRFLAKRYLANWQFNIDNPKLS